MPLNDTGKFFCRIDATRAAGYRAWELSRQPITFPVDATLLHGGRMINGLLTPSS